jgi:hypothetical protein
MAISDLNGTYETYKRRPGGNLDPCSGNLIGSKIFSESLMIGNLLILVYHVKLCVFSPPDLHLPDDELMCHVRQLQACEQLG